MSVTVDSHADSDSTECTSEFDKEIKATRSDIVAKMETLGEATFRVTFDKQVTAKMMSERLEGKDISTPAKRRKLATELMQGERRVMHARLCLGSEGDPDVKFGRFKVIDLQLDEAKECPIRFVDTRTIVELVFERVRYHVQ